jgi:beta-phosphoglucomutase-like phosphatase (HAD superfamily)
MSKKYKAIFFDWDGTAVMSRQAPVEEAVAAMKPLRVLVQSRGWQAAGQECKRQLAAVEAVGRSAAARRRLRFF